jgi:dTDP-4-dehydrorhamnose 3,5-epimerase
VKRVDEPLPGLLLLHQPWAVDERGAVRELHRDEWLGEADLATMGRPTFVQDNATVSRRGVLRGLHFQRGPAGQGKLIQVVTGQIYDVAVDLRAGSSSYGQHFAINLVAERGMVLWIPPGFAHGFLVRSDQAVVVYKLTAVYDPAAQRALRWDDPALGIRWPLIDPPTLSASDAEAPTLAALTAAGQVPA